MTEAGSRKWAGSSRVLKRLSPGERAIDIARRVALGCYNDGFIHAGNLAYLAMLAIFPFFITGAAIFSLIGEADEQRALIASIIVALPPPVAEVIGPVAFDVVAGRTGWLLWIGGIFGLWTVGSLVETIRDILHRAYHTKPSRSFWHYRLTTSGIVVGAVLLLLVSLLSQVLISTVEELIAAWFPAIGSPLDALGWSRLVAVAGVFVAIHLLFVSLTPHAYRTRRFPKWPGAALVTLWWLAVSTALPPAVAGLLDYDATYGSLAGMMIALFFFWLVGLGVVAGVELNAALAQIEKPRRGKRKDAADDRIDAGEAGPDHGAGQ